MPNNSRKFNDDGSSSVVFERSNVSMSIFLLLVYVTILFYNIQDNCVFLRTPTKTTKMAVQMGRKVPVKVKVLLLKLLQVRVVICKITSTNLYFTE